MNERTAERQEIRTAMRSRRRDLPDRSGRSRRIIERLVALDVVSSATTLIAYEAIEGEVDTLPLIAWCAANGVAVAMPEPDVTADLAAIDPAWGDVLVVPGLAFTERCERLGQGGGWYDRFLLGRRSDAVTIGVGFEPQMVDDLPVESHDVLLDCVVTDERTVWRV